ncbi:sensor histidine kinase [Clostridium estertheticum]|uniref:sensor histidine kinase n=2 Tax=Clostridium estertheticum TaxID=238834 RepID=UPI001C0C7232|nr:sensor histidine kinase [Clostridium estertheticum]MBU3214579.1 sensor histidine kinase [Clostridium estertheticum]
MRRIKFSNLKLMQKFLLSYFMLIIIPLILLSSITYKTVSTILETYITSATKQAFEQTYSFLSYKLYRINDVSDIISNDNNITTIDSNLITILGKSPNTYPINEQIKDMFFLRKYLSSYENNIDVSNLKLYVNNDFLYSTEDYNMFSLNKAKNSKWLTIFKENNTRNLWCPSSYLEDKPTSSPKELSLVSAIKNPNDFSKDIGFLRVDFKKSMVDDIIKKTNSIDGSFTYIQNSKGVIVSSTDDSLIAKYNLNNTLTTSLSSNTQNFQKLTINNNKCLLKSSLINNTDWYMTTIIPYDSILVKIKFIRNTLILLLSILGTIAFTLAYYFSNSITRRITKLNKSMRQVHTGSLETYIKDSSSDEIGELIDNYNFMITKMVILIDEQYKSGKEVKNAELKALQAQINPHFLYNTLDMINWMAFKDMNKEISSAVKSLAGFYKISLNKGKSKVSIKDELTHASLYVDIQNMRYSDRIKLIIDLPEELYCYSILKITLQPILENSISHGILGRGNVCGEILISGKLENNDITLYVKDDGIGIPDDKIDKILTDDISSKTGSGYGLKNIDKRLKLSYGEGYGLTFKSQYGHGTTVEIKIPATVHEDGFVL